MRRVVYSVFGIVALFAVFTYGQDRVFESQSSIAKLLDGFQKAAVAGAPLEQFFSPSVRTSEKDQIESLQRKEFIKFEFVNYSLKELQFPDAAHATLPVTVQYSTRDEESSRTTTLRFVCDQGAWYFANADFWEVSFVWFFPIIAYAVAYGCGVV